MAYDSDSAMNSIARYFPEVAARWALNERSVFAVPVDKASVRADERNMARPSRDASAAMTFDTAASASRGPSIAAMFGPERWLRG